MDEGGALIQWHPPHPRPLPLTGGEGKVSLVCVGSELLRGKINTHGSLLARCLATIGLELGEELTVGDDLGAIARAIRRALDHNPVVLVTGGLGPTFDDVTREAASLATDKPLERSQVLLRGIQAKFRRARLHAMPPSNKQQAYLLKGAIPIPNSVGTAPGQLLLLPPLRGKVGMGGGPPPTILPHHGGGGF